MIMNFRQIICLPFQDILLYFYLISVYLLIAYLHIILFVIAGFINVLAFYIFLTRVIDYQ